MASLYSISVRRPVLATVMSLAIVIGGVIGLQRLGVRECLSKDEVRRLPREGEFDPLRARPQEEYRLLDAVHATGLSELLPGSADDLAGRAGFDRDSYHVGETAVYRIRLLWRDDAVDPDLETFRNGIGLFPFHRRETRESRRELPGNIGEYTLEYVLQAVDVTPSGSHLLSPSHSGSSTSTWPPHTAYSC